MAWPDCSRFLGQCRDTANGAFGHIAGNWSHAIDSPLTDTVSEDVDQP